MVAEKYLGRSRLFQRPAGLTTLAPIWISFSLSVFDQRTTLPRSRGRPTKAEMGQTRSFGFRCRSSACPQTERFDGAAQTYPTTAWSFGGAGVTPTCAPAQRLGDPCTLMRVVKDSVTGGSNDGHLYLDVRLSCLRAHRRRRAIGVQVEPILTTRSDSLDERSPSIC
jgi:hypothetical protein